MAIRHAEAVKEFDRGVGQGIRAVGHGAVDRGGGGYGGAETEVYISCLHPLYIKTGAVIQVENILHDIGHLLVTS